MGIKDWKGAGSCEWGVREDIGTLNAECSVLNGRKGDSHLWQKVAVTFSAVLLVFEQVLGVAGGEGVADLGGLVGGGLVGGRFFDGW